MKGSAIIKFPVTLDARSVNETRNLANHLIGMAKEEGQSPSVALKGEARAELLCSLLAKDFPSITYRDLGNENFLVYDQKDPPTAFMKAG